MKADVILRRHKDVWKMPTAALSFQLDEHYQTEAARARLAEWKKKANRDDCAHWRSESIAPKGETGKAHVVMMPAAPKPRA